MHTAAQIKLIRQDQVGFFYVVTIKMNVTKKSTRCVIAVVQTWQYGQSRVQTKQGSNLTG
jgi:hypothetical protein